VEAERSRLIAGGRDDLAADVLHVSVVEGDGLGYDIRSLHGLTDRLGRGDQARGSRPPRHTRRVDRTRPAPPLRGSTAKLYDLSDNEDLDAVKSAE
jgi:hypothetical protein